MKPGFWIIAAVVQVLNIAFLSDFARAQPCSQDGEIRRTANIQRDEPFAACSETGAAAGRTPTVEIGNDDGGLVASYALRLYEIREAKQKIAFVGRCDSACTLFLALPAEQTCITEGAYFRFHAPSAPSASAAEAVGAYMMRKYPDWVRAWIVAQGGLTDRLATMNYQYASRFMRTCG